jgi:hypothetical protein
VAPIERASLSRQLDSIHRLVVYLKHDVSETGFYLTNVVTGRRIISRIVTLILDLSKSKLRIQIPQKN